MEDKIKVAGEIAAHTYPLSEKSLCRLAAILEPRKLLKNELFLKEGDVARSMGVVEQEITEHFTYEGHLFVCLESFIRQIPGQFYVEALEPTLIYEIPYGPFHELMQQDPEILRVYCTILESSLIISQHKADARNRHSAFERYRRLEFEHPQIVRRAPQIHVASFLGMSPETLSRIRAGKIS